MLDLQVKQVPRVNRYVEQSAILTNLDIIGLFSVTGFIFSFLATLKNSIDNIFLRSNSALMERIYSSLHC